MVLQVIEGARYIDLDAIEALLETIYPDEFWSVTVSLAQVV
jgi:hypothetical protein